MHGAGGAGGGSMLVATETAAGTWRERFAEAGRDAPALAERGGEG
jgi:hypothetical protein